MSDVEAAWTVLRLAKGQGVLNVLSLDERNVAMYLLDVTGLLSITATDADPFTINILTALADDEVDHEETRGKLYHLRYPFADGSGHVVVATTRPETMLGDTGVAVHPDDPRYDRSLRLTAASFEEIGLISGLAFNADGIEQASMGVDVADYDNDGFVDLYVSNKGGSNKLYMNNGDGSFKDVTATAGAGIDSFRSGRASARFSLARSGSSGSSSTRPLPS